MSHCIYCPATNFTPEHHVPRALGNFKGYLTLNDRVCEKCNGICGKLDEQLSRSGLEAFFRKQLGIEGRKKHKKANPFYRGSAGGGRLEMMGISHLTGDNVLLELVGDNEARELRCVRLTSEDDKVYVITIPDGMTPDQFKAKFDSLGISRFKTADISAGEEEIEWVESLFQKIKFENRTDWALPAKGPITYGPIRIRFVVNSRYFRCIAKIGFHYFLTRIPRFRGDEDCFADLRRFIIEDCKLEDCKRFVTFTPNEFIPLLRAAMHPDEWGHFVGVETDYLSLRAKIQLFVGPRSPLPVYTVQLGTNPSRVHYAEAIADLLAFYPKERRREFDGEVRSLR